MAVHPSARLRVTLAKSQALLASLVVGCAGAVLVSFRLLFARLALFDAALGLLLACAAVGAAVWAQVRVMKSTTQAQLAVADGACLCILASVVDIVAAVMLPLAARVLGCTSCAPRVVAVNAFLFLIKTLLSFAFPRLGLRAGAAATAHLIEMAFDAVRGMCLFALLSPTTGEIGKVVQTFAVLGWATSLFCGAYSARAVPMQETQSAQ